MDAKHMPNLPKFHSHDGKFLWEPVTNGIWLHKKSNYSNGHEKDDDGEFLFSEIWEVFSNINNNHAIRQALKALRHADGKIRGPIMDGPELDELNKAFAKRGV